MPAGSRRLIEQVRIAEFRGELQFAHAQREADFGEAEISGLARQWIDDGIQIAGLAKKRDGLMRP